MIFSLLNNPLTKLAVGKITDHLKHKAEKVKTIREAEIQACKEVDVQRIKSQDKSYKDELLLIWIIGMLSTGFFDSTRDNFEEWVRIINDLPDSVWYLVIIVFTATFSACLIVLTFSALCLKWSTALLTTIFVRGFFNKLNHIL